MTAFRFVQFSDVHLDSAATGGRLDLPPEKHVRRRGELRQAVTAACRLAVEERVDAILIPGDLLDDESGTPETVNFLADTFESVAPVPVVIAPGNHDPYSRVSPYNRAWLEQRRQKTWPEHVIIFDQPAFTSVVLPTVPHVSVTGMTHTYDRSPEDRVLARRIDRPDTDINILLLHGSRADHLPTGKSVTLPFSDAELQEQGFHYTAVGHYHSCQFITDDRERIIGAYAGCPAGRTVRETGEKCVLVGEVHPGRGTALERRRVDARTIHEVVVDCTGRASSEAVRALIERRVAEVTTDARDMVSIQVHGRFPPGNVLELPPDFLQDRYFHTAIDTSGVRPDYDLTAYSDTGPAASVEAQFVRELTAAIEADSDPDRRAVLEDALYYGLDALVQQSISVRRDS